MGWDNLRTRLLAAVRLATCVCSNTNGQVWEALWEVRTWWAAVTNPIPLLHKENRLVPPAGFEPALPPPEGDALSPELRGLGPAQASSARAKIIGVRVIPVASPMWPVPGVSSSSMTTT